MRQSADAGDALRRPDFPGDMVVMDRTGVVVVPSGKTVKSTIRLLDREARGARGGSSARGKTLTESRKPGAASRAAGLKNRYMT